MSHELLVDELSAGLTPVRRRDPMREVGWIAGLGALELTLFLAAGAMRPDMVAVIGHPFMWWKFGSLACLVVIGVVTAVRSFSPAVSPRRGLAISAFAVALTLVAGAAVTPDDALAATLVERLAPIRGLRCATGIVILSLPMLALLSVLMRKGASTHAEGSALAVGLAGGGWGAFVFTFYCDVNDPLYVVVWYSIGCAVVALAARAVLPRYAAL